MSAATDRLRVRRAALLGRAELQRLELRAHAGRIASVADSADRGLRLVHKLATPTVLVGGAVAAVLLLRRGRARKAVAAGITILGLLQRFRTAGQLLATLTGAGRRTHPVRRSR